MTPYEWMMAQLYATFVFGSDIFRTINEKVLRQCDLITVDDMLSEGSKKISLVFHCFVDEAQVLLETCPKYFVV